MSGFERNMEAVPYTAHEKRVCEYLLEITNNQIGCGSDPIGFLIASHGAINRTRKNQREVIKALTVALEDAKQTIQALHGPIAWDIYNGSSPEMKRLNAAIAKAEELGE